MHSKKHQMMRLTSTAVTARLKDILKKDFSESLSAQIIKQNYYRHGFNLNSLKNGGKKKLVNSIISDYKAINPIGSVSADQLKKDLHLAINSSSIIYLNYQWNIVNQESADKPV